MSHVSPSDTVGRDIEKEDSVVRLEALGPGCRLGRCRAHLKLLDEPQKPARYSVPAKPACVTTLPQRAISEAMKRSSSSVEDMLPGIIPSLMICCWTSGKASTAVRAP